MKTLRTILLLLFSLPIITNGQWEIGRRIIQYPLNEMKIQDIYLAYDNTIYATAKSDYHSILYKSIDEGYSWKEIKRFEDMDHLYFIDEFSREFKQTTPVWITNGEMISYDLGESWSPCTMYDKVDSDECEFFFCDKDLGWVYYYSGGDWYNHRDFILEKTMDGGITWNNELNTSYPISIQDLYFINKNKGYLLGNGGDIFILHWESDPWWIERISFLLWEFKDNAWERINALKITGKSDSLDLKGIKLRSIDFIDEQTGWLAGSSDQGSFLLKTIDGGESWKDITSGYYKFFDMHFLNENEGWALGASGNFQKLFYTDNGGIDWYAYNNSSLFGNKLQMTEDFGWIVNRERNPDGSLNISEFQYIRKESTGKTDKAPTLSQPVIFPNPFTFETRIQLPGNSIIKHIEIIDITGKTHLIIKDLNQEIFTLQRNQLKSGIYFLKVTGEKEYSGRVVIK